MSQVVPAMLTSMVFEVEPMEDEEEDYTLETPEYINSYYEPEDEEEDTATSVEISPPPKPSYRSYRSHITGTQVNTTLRKTRIIPSKKRRAYTPSFTPPTKKPYRDYSWMS